MSTVNVKFGDWIQAGLNLYKANFVTLLLVTLLAMVLSALTIGILAGPMSAGVIMITLALLDRREPKPEVGEIFKGFSLFLPTFLYTLGLMVVLIVGSIILNLIPCLGQVLGLLYSFAVQALTMFALFNIVDKKMELVPAVQASVEVVKANFWPLLGFNVIASIIGGAGAIACGIGMIFTMPLYFCILSVAYRDIAASTAKPVA